MGYEYCDLLLTKQFTQQAEKFIDESLKETQPYISAITEIELLCWRTATENDLALLRSFISDVFVIELEQPIKIRTAEIRKQLKLKLPDAIIAVTALVYNLTLITRNISDFKNIQGLKFIDPSLL